MIPPRRQPDQAAKARLNLILTFIIAAFGLLLSGGVIATIVYLFLSLTSVSSTAPALSAPGAAGSIARSPRGSELLAISASDCLSNRWPQLSAIPDRFQIKR